MGRIISHILFRTSEKLETSQKREMRSETCYFSLKFRTVKSEKCEVRNAK